MIDLFTAATPNGYKISIALEEMALPYNLTNIDFREKEQKASSFLELNPNGRIPVIVDRENNDFVLFESGAILIYLAEKSGMFYGENDKQRYKIIQWLMFQMSGVGPMMGQANVFFRYFPEKIQPAIDRYQNESKRLLTVLDTQLQKHEFLAGEYSIADIATWPWAKIHLWSGIEIDDLPNLQRWITTVAERPAVVKGSNLPPRAEAENIVKAGQTMVQK